MDRRRDEELRRAKKSAAAIQLTPADDPVVDLLEEESEALARLPPPKPPGQCGSQASREQEGAKSQGQAWDWRRQQSGPRWPFYTVNGPCASSADHQRWHAHTQMARRKERKGRWSNTGGLPINGGAGADFVFGCLPL